MNRFFLLVIFITLFSTCFSSCSFMQRRPPEVNQPTNPNSSGNMSSLAGSSLSSSSTEVVSKAQYDELLVKHQRLLRNAREKGVMLEEDKDNSSSESMSLSKEDNSISEKNNETDSLIEGVEATAAMATTSTSTSTSPKNHLSDDTQLENEIAELTKALEMLANKRYSNAMKSLQTIENSKFKQIKVRAKFYVGEILLLQKEYDLAMQVYEDIANKYAFSSMTLRALDRVALCAKKLSLKDKYEKYASLRKIFD
ncbi:MAG: hypothetical protein HQK51_09225 [Oligoflexia bacterium]|nr:hypothetical protein [Oligoflexia bacterium]